ncbi:MAG: hypothetical protein EBT95_10605 [Verrucomicrobia bacterium]|nr:hypothetical protein [Verrucomicrobiota bacterium]
MMIQTTTQIPASAVIAMAIFESGYGNSVLAKEYNNYFGMKAFGSWTGPRAMNMPTRDNGVETTADFRAYPDARQRALSPALGGEIGGQVCLQTSFLRLLPGPAIPQPHSGHRAKARTGPARCGPRNDRREQGVRGGGNRRAGGAPLRNPELT